MHFNRFTAFSIHLVLSILVFSSLVITMYFFWFPGDLFFLDGGFQGLKLVALVDLVLGPLLTLLLIKPGKKKKPILIDMTMIAVFQLSALAYGFYATYQQQTVAIVFAEAKFNTLSRSAYNEASAQLIEREITPQKLNQFNSKPYPYHIYTVKPTGKSMGRFIADLLNGYPEAHERSDKYLALSEHYEEMRQDRASIESLQNAGIWQTVKQALNNNNHSVDKIDLYHFNARYASGIVAFDPTKMRIVDYIKIDPTLTAGVIDTDTTKQQVQSALE